jgi:hypothetical protein
MTKGEKTIELSKKIFNYLKDNAEEAKQVLRSNDKRRKKNLPVAVVDSSDLSQSAIIEVSISGMKPNVGKGKESIRDMPIVRRKKVDDEDEDEDEDDNDNDVVDEVVVEVVDEAEQGNVDDNNDDNEETDQEEAIVEKDNEGDGVNLQEVEEAAAAELPEKLKVIVNDLYDTIITPVFNRTITQTPALELSEFTFVPLTLTSPETLHLASFKENGLLAEKTKRTANSSYSLRCYNTYLAQLALVEKLMELYPAKTEAQVIYSLKELFKASLATNIDINIDAEWSKLKQCSKRGKALYDFMKELNLGTYGNLLF